MLYLSAAVLALGNYDRVEAIVNESNAIAQQKSDHWARAFGLDLLGNVAIARGEVQAAIESFQQSLVLSQEIGDQWAATLTLIHLGDAQLALNDRAGAHQLFRKAYENARQARWLSTILEVLVAALAADDQIPNETRLAIAQAVQSNPSTNLPTRQRAVLMSDQLTAALNPQQIEAAQHLSQQKTAEEWAIEFFTEQGAERQLN
jgi:tetratricopeptide (TPR) repeat protein